MEEHKNCKFEEKIMEMYGDIKTLLSEFKNMNGKLVSTKEGFDDHNEESKLFRHQVTIMWATLQTIKWAVGLLIASGLLLKLIQWVIKL